MIFKPSNFNKRYRAPQSTRSVTLPNQVVDLSVLVKQLLQGQSLNVGLSLQRSSEYTFDSPDLLKEDLKHITPSKLETYIAKFTPSDESDIKSN